MNHIGPPCHAGGCTGYGDADSGVVVVGIAPGANEVKQGRPFVGRSGKLLDACLTAYGWSREHVYCTNLVCWWNNEPTIQEIASCSDRFELELQQVKPKLIIGMGALVCEALTGHKIGKARGSVLWSDKYQSYILPTWHPAAILHGSTTLIYDLVRDLSKIKTVLDWPPHKPPCATVEYVIVHTPAQAQTVLNTLPTNVPVAIDVETSNPEIDHIDVYSDKLLCFSISTGTFTYWFPPHVFQDKQLVWPQDVQWTAHNGMFDFQVLYHHLGVRTKPAHDTLLMSYALDERGAQHHGLKRLAREYLGSGFYEENIAAARKTNSLAHVQLNELAHYNSHDSCYTARLADIFIPRLRADNTYDMYQNLLMPVSHTFTEIQYRGMYISQDKIREVSLELFPKQMETEDALQASARELGFPGKINLASPVQVCKLLYDVIKLPLPDGRRSTDKEARELLDHPWVDQFSYFKEIDHTIGSYILPLPEFIKSDGRLHAEVFIPGTVTGRLSYRNPPLQTIPRAWTDRADLGLIRKMFSATTPDYIIYEADYKTAEVYMAAAYSQDDVMMADLATGDFHRYAAAAYFEVPIDQVTKIQRYESKFVTFGMMYKRGARAIAKQLKCSVAQAQKYVTNFFNRYQKYRDWSRAIEQQIYATGELQTMNGRKRRFPLPDAESVRQGVNFPIQSSASDNTLYSLVKLHPLLKQLDSYILLALHDCLVFEVSRRHESVVTQIIDSVMNDSHYPGFPRIPIEFKVGPTWGDAKEVEYSLSKL